MDDIDKIKEELSGMLKGLPDKIKAMQDEAVSNKPKTSRRVLIDGMEAIATLTQGDNITLEFINKSHSETFLNSLVLK